MAKHIEEKQVALGDYEFLRDLTAKWMCWHGESPTKMQLGLCRGQAKLLKWTAGTWDLKVW